MKLDFLKQLHVFTYLFFQIIESDNHQNGEKSAGVYAEIRGENMHSIEHDSEQEPLLIENKNDIQSNDEHLQEESEIMDTETSLVAKFSPSNFLYHIYLGVCCFSIKHVGSFSVS